MNTDELRWMPSRFIASEGTSKGQREDSSTIVTLLDRVKELHDEAVRNLSRYIVAKEENEKLLHALCAVETDAIKCAESPSQYFITQWAMDKVEKALVEKYGDKKASCCGGTIVPCPLHT